MIHSWQSLNKGLTVTLVLSLPSLGRVQYDRLLETKKGHDDLSEDGPNSLEVSSARMATEVKLEIGVRPHRV